MCYSYVLLNSNAHTLHIMMSLIKKFKEIQCLCWQSSQYLPHLTQAFSMPHHPHDLDHCLPLP
jgi:hypothetical protein